MEQQDIKLWLENYFYEEPENFDPILNRRREILAQNLEEKYSKTNKEYKELVEVNQKTTKTYLEKLGFDQEKIKKFLHNSKLNMHGAIRIPTDKGYAELGKFLIKFFGLKPYNIYDFRNLAKPLPVIATALKANNCPQFFYSKIALDGISKETKNIYKKYVPDNAPIFSDKVKSLIDKFYANQISEKEEEKLIHLLIQDWMNHQYQITDKNNQKLIQKHIVEKKEYEIVKNESPYLADLIVRSGRVCVNHLTPTAVDIKGSHIKMKKIYGMIDLQGPDTNKTGHLIQLRQMSNHAVPKPLILRTNNNELIETTHTPMFVEFEYRGYAPTKKGEEILNQNPKKLKEKALEQLISEELIYSKTINGKKFPVKYEGFLSKSARNIFKSTLGDEQSKGNSENNNLNNDNPTEILAKLLAHKITDLHEIYSKIN